MHSYQTSAHGPIPAQSKPYSGPKLPPPPAHQAVDPRAVAAALQMMQQQSQPGMSRTDTIVIQNAPEPPPVVISGQVDPFQQQAVNFSRSPVGQAQIHSMQPCGYQMGAQDEVANALIRQRTAEVLASAMGYAQSMDPNKPGAQYGNYIPYLR